MIYKDWKQNATTTRILVLGAEDVSARSATPVQACGVSLAWLEKLAGSVKPAATGSNSTSIESCDDVVAKLLIPLTAETSKCRLWNLIPVESTGHPDWYVTFSGTMAFADMVRQVSFSLAPPPAMVKRLEEEGVAADAWKHRVFLWLHMVSMPLHPLQPGESSDLGLMRTTIHACSEGALAVVDAQHKLLSRTLCMYVAWLAVYYEAVEKLMVALPVEHSVQNLRAFLTKSGSLDMKKTETKLPEDKAHALSEIKSSVGMQRMLGQVAEGLQRATLCALRWSGRVCDLATYCCLMLECGEYCQLHVVLCTIPELVDNEQGLQEIRDIFQVYDADGSGELDHEEFYDFLEVAGFNRDEAETIFSQVKDGEAGLVTLPEFEKWWIVTQREQKMLTRDIHLTTSALRTNITNMVAYLERNGLPQQAQIFKKYDAKAKAGSILQGDLPLPSPQLRGEWQAIAEHVALKVANADPKEVKAANRSLYELLMLNGEMLDICPSILPPPEGPSEVAPQKLEVYMELLLMLLRRQGPPQSRLAEFFGITLGSFRASWQQVAAGNTRKKQNQQIEFSIIRNTVAMKYGLDEPLTKQRVQEAQYAVSQFIASTRLAAARDARTAKHNGAGGAVGPAAGTAQGTCADILAAMNTVSANNARGAAIAAKKKAAESIAAAGGAKDAPYMGGFLIRNNIAPRQNAGSTDATLGASLNALPVALAAIAADSAAAAAGEPLKPPSRAGMPAAGPRAWRFSMTLPGVVDTREEGEEEEEEGAGHRKDRSTSDTVLHKILSGAVPFQTRVGLERRAPSCNGTLMTTASSGECEEGAAGQEGAGPISSSSGQLTGLMSPLSPLSPLSPRKVVVGKLAGAAAPSLLRASRSVDMDTALASSLYGTAVCMERASMDRASIDRGSTERSSVDRGSGGSAYSTGTNSGGNQWGASLKDAVLKVKNRRSSALGLIGGTGGEDFSSLAGAGAGEALASLQLLQEAATLSPGAHVPIGVLRPVTPPPGVPQLQAVAPACPSQLHQQSACSPRAAKLGLHAPITKAYSADLETSHAHTGWPNSALSPCGGSTGGAGGGGSSPSSSSQAMSLLAAPVQKKAGAAFRRHSRMLPASEMEVHAAALLETEGGGGGDRGSTDRAHTPTLFLPNIRMRQ